MVERVGNTSFSYSAEVIDECEYWLSVVIKIKNTKIAVVILTVYFKLSLDIPHVLELYSTYINLTLNKYHNYLILQVEDFN